MNLKNKKIVVLMGGNSSEREISLLSGQAVFAALLKQGYNCHALDLQGNWAQQILDAAIDVAFICLHGRLGEDGCVQGLLEVLGIPYTASGPLASSLAMDKFLVKELLKSFDIPEAEHLFFQKNVQEPEQFLKDFSANFSKPAFPVMVKASREGSSRGIFLAKNEIELLDALRKAAEYDNRVLVERFVQGREVTVAVLSGQAMPIVEIKTENSFFDFEAKYQSQQTSYEVPAELESGLAEKLSSWSELIYRHLDCSGVIRVDYMLDQESQPYFLELNTIPGMTTTSLVPKSARQHGLAFEVLVEKILETASLKNH